MAWIEQIPPSQATGRLKASYDAALSRAGGVARIITLMSLDPPTLERSMEFYMQLMHADNALLRARKEMLAAVVSNVNECYY